MTPDRSVQAWRSVSAVVFVSGLGELALLLAVAVLPWDWVRAALLLWVAASVLVLAGVLALG